MFIKGAALRPKAAPLYKEKNNPTYLSSCMSEFFSSLLSSSQSHRSQSKQTNCCRFWRDREITCSSGRIFCRQRKAKVRLDTRKCVIYDLAAGQRFGLAVCERITGNRECINQVGKRCCSIVPRLIDFTAVKKTGDGGAGGTARSIGQSYAGRRRRIGICHRVKYHHV